MAGPLGVLLPLRIETVFDRPAHFDGAWRLRLLLVPDTVAIDTHTGARPAELALVRRLWKSSGGNLSTPAGAQAFARLAENLGPGRAAWLVRTFPPRRDGAGALWPDSAGEVVLDATASVQQDATIGAIRGLPRRIDLWFARSEHGPIEHLEQLQVTTDPLVPEEFDLDEPHWLWNWEKAEDAGLGITINLKEKGNIDHPSEIRVLLATGLGDEDALELFQHHRDSGRLSFIKHGSPTNTIGGAPTVDWGGDANAWLTRAVSPVSTRASRRLSLALGGPDDALQGMPDPSGDHVEVNRTIVQSLWYAVWGHGLKEIWGVAETHVAGEWAGEHLLPEGPLPPIRVGDQPYGVLPVTSLARWKQDGADPEARFAAVEAAIVPTLASLRRAFADAARSGGTVEGANSERLLALIGRLPVSAAFAYRAFLPLHTLWMLMKLFGGSVSLAELVDWWEQRSGAVLAHPVNPPRAYATRGPADDVRLPLVDPKEPPFHHVLKELLHLFETHGPEAFARDHRERPQPNSLLLRLWIYSMLIADAELTRAAAGNVDPLVEPLSRTDGDSELWRAVFTTSPSIVNDPAVAGTPQLRLYKNIGRIHRLLAFEIDEIERVLCATLDCAGHRIDPWITGLAWRRLRTLRDAGAPAVLGVYSWVDRPFSGVPGPTAGGLIHAPTHAQAQAAVILRDKAVHDFEAARWKMNLTSSAVRLAKQIADRVREGTHLAEALGAEVERIAGDRDRIAHLRRAYPMRTEHAGRRVCDGLKILEETVTANLQLDARQLAELEQLRGAVDAYGDLLIADGVYQLVTGKPDVGGKSMDAAAGLALPPTLDVLTTRRTGWSLTTTVVQVLRDVTPPNPLTLGSSPGAIGEPALAAWLVERLGAATTAGWTWRFDRNGVSRTVTLSAVGLDPVDAIGLDLDSLEFLLRQELPDAGRGWQVAANAIGRASWEQARRLVNMLARQPALARDLFPDAAPSARDDVNAADQAQTVELRKRYTQLRGAATLLAAHAEATLAIGEGAEDAVVGTALQHLARWGIVPSPLEHETLFDRLSRAQASFSARLAKVVDAAGAASLGAHDLAAAIGELAAPGGRLRVHARMPVQMLRNRGLAAAPNVRGAWLETVAAVRPALARVESALLADDGEEVFDVFCDHPNDPWQRLVIQTNEQRAAVGQDTPAPLPMTVAFAASGALDQGAAPDDVVAVGLLDSWGETVPRREHHTTAAFGFNAPAAQAPQAVLLAVPPRGDLPLDAATLADIVMETRELAHARMASPDDLGQFAQALPLTFLSTAGHAGVTLEVKP